MNTPTDYKLCFIEAEVAYFTTQEVTQQRGEGWSAKPYEHNAGRPYRFDNRDKEAGRNPWDIRSLYFSSPMQTPADVADFRSHYSAKDINAGAVAWLYGDGMVIYAGITLIEFVDKIRQSGGDVFMSEEQYLWLRDYREARREQQ